MSLFAAIGQSRAIDGREAGRQAARQVLDQVGRVPYVLGWVIASGHFPIMKVFSGVSSIFGDVPLLGFSTSGELTTEGQNQRSVVVALLTGEDLQARTDWWPGFSEDSKACTNSMIQALRSENRPGSTLMVVTDGLKGDAATLCKALPPGDYTLAVCLAGGDLIHGRTYQIDGRQSGTGGLAAARINGKVAVGVGIYHGWQVLSAASRVTRVKGHWVRTLDGRRASDMYSILFGHKPREWTAPPLNQLVRLYPFGIEQDENSSQGSTQYKGRSPMRVEVDNSLRINTVVPEGTTAYLMTGSLENCLSAAKRVTQLALDSLGSSRPIMALIFVDVAWQMLLESNPDSDVHAVCSVHGQDVPIVGGYTFGQIAHSQPIGTQNY